MYEAISDTTNDYGDHHGIVPRTPDQVVKLLM